MQVGFGLVSVGLDRVSILFQFFNIKVFGRVKVKPVTNKLDPRVKLALAFEVVQVWIKRWRKTVLVQRFIDLVSFCARRLPPVAHPLQMAVPVPASHRRLRILLDWLTLERSWLRLPVGSRPIMLADSF